MNRHLLVKRLNRDVYLLYVLVVEHLEIRRGVIALMYPDLLQVVVQNKVPLDQRLGLEKFVVFLLLLQEALNRHLLVAHGGTDVGGEGYDVLAHLGLLEVVAVGKVQRTVVVEVGLQSLDDAGLLLDVNRVVPYLLIHQLSYLGTNNNIINQNLNLNFTSLFHC